MNYATTSPKWLSQKQAAQVLNVSERTLARLRQTGMEPGTCWRRKVPNNPNSHVLYNIERCDEYLHHLATTDDCFAEPMTTQHKPLEDLLAEWWRDSYPSSTLNPQTGRMMVAFAAWVLALRSREIDA